MKEREAFRGIFNAIGEVTENSQVVVFGIVKELRLEDLSIIVTLMPDEIETNWLRISRLASGDNVLIGGLPEVGQEVICLLHGSDPNDVIILDAYPPAEDQEMEDVFEDEKDFFIIPRHGGKIKFTKDGIILDPGDLKVYVGGKDNSKKLVTEDFINQIFNLHTHPGNGTPPVQQGSDAQMTTKVKAV